MLNFSHPYNIKKLSIFEYGCLIYLFLFLTYSFNFFITYDFLPYPFFYNRFDTFMDFFNVNYWSWKSTVYTEWRSIYTPLNLSLARALTMPGCQYALSSIELRTCSFNSLIFSFITYILIILALFKINGKNKDGYIVIALISISMPMLFAIERGNYILIATLLMAVYVLFFDRYSWLTTIILVNIKIYLLPIFMLDQLKYKLSKILINIIIILFIQIIFGIILSNNDWILIPKNLLYFSSARAGSWFDSASVATTIFPIFNFYSHYYEIGDAYKSILYFFNILIVFTIITRFIIYFINTVKTTYDEKYVALVYVTTMLCILTSPAYYSIILIFPLFIYSLKRGYLSLYSKVIFMLMLLPYPLKIHSERWFGPENTHIFDNIVQLRWITLNSLMIPVLLLLFMYELTKYKFEEKNNMTFSKLKIDYLKYILNDEIVKFTYKLLLVLLLIVFSTNYVKTSFKDLDPTIKSKLFLHGLITNPQALYLLSLENEKSGNIRMAIVDIELAIALLSNTTNRANLDKFNARLKFLTDLNSQNIKVY